MAKKHCSPAEWQDGEGDGPEDWMPEPRPDVAARGQPGPVAMAVTSGVPSRLAAPKPTKQGSRDGPLRGTRPGVPARCLLGSVCP